MIWIAAAVVLALVIAAVAKSRGQLQPRAFVGAAPVTLQSIAAELQPVARQASSAVDHLGSYLKSVTAEAETRALAAAASEHVNAVAGTIKATLPNLAGTPAPAPLPAAPPLPKG